MYCKTCGKEINENAVVCVNCGVLLDNATLEQINGHKESKKTNVCALVGFILSLVGFVLGIYVSPLIVAGFILSIIGLTQYKKTGVGKGFAIAGIAISASAFALYFIIFMSLMFSACWWNFWYC